MVQEQALYPALYFILPILVDAVLPHLAFVVHAAYAVEFDIEFFDRTVVSSGYSFPVFHMCKDVLDRNTSFGVCLVLYLFGGGKLFALGFFVWDLCIYPTKIVLDSRVASVQIQAYATIRWYAFAGHHTISPFAKFRQSLGQHRQIMAASLSRVTYCEDIVLFVYHHGCVYCKHLTLSRVLFVLLFLILWTRGLYKRTVYCNLASISSGYNFLELRF